MKILVISQEVWRDDKNGGNVLSNIFKHLDAEFAQIYCSPGTPSNNLCKKYYQITDSMIIRNILKKEKIGKKYSYETFPNDEMLDKPIQENKKFYKFFRRFRLNIFLAIKEMMWLFSQWKTKELEQFIIEFDPDIIFAPCYASHFMLKLDRYIGDLTKKPIISYISDDNYSLKQFQMSPVFWINRMILRRNMRKTFKYYNLTYTMTEEQLEECKAAFKCNIKILKKGADFSENVLVKKTVNTPIRLVYAGGIYLGRANTLCSLANAIREINKDGKKFVLDIYTANELNVNQSKLLNDGENCNVYGVVTQRELVDLYKSADIALHVEGFDLKNKYATRISFSTKIIDLLASSCAIMVISWNKHSGYTYLKKNNAAVCVDNPKLIKNELINLYNNPSLIAEFAQNAWTCGVEKHQIDYVTTLISQDFNELYKESIEKGGE